MKIHPSHQNDPVSIALHSLDKGRELCNCGHAYQDLCQGKKGAGCDAAKGRTRTILAEALNRCPCDEP